MQLSPQGLPLEQRLQQAAFSGCSPLFSCIRRSIKPGSGAAKTSGVVCLGKAKALLAKESTIAPAATCFNLLITIPTLPPLTNVNRFLIFNLQKLNATTRS